MRIVYFDTETTGVDFESDRIIELALVVVDDGKVVLKYDKFVNIGESLPSEIVELTGITDEMLVRDGVSDGVVARDLWGVISGRRDTLMVAHNCQFDLCFIYALLCKFYSVGRVDALFGRLSWLDSLTVFKDRKKYPHKLVDLVDYYDLGEFTFHRAIDDTLVLPLALASMNRERGDVLKYVNVFGYNRKYGVSGKRFDFISYIPQDFHFGIVKSSDILPLTKR